MSKRNYESAVGPGGDSESAIGPGGEEKQNAGLLYANNLVYTFPHDYSVAVNNTKKEQLFAQRNYTDGDTMQCTLMTGADYVDPLRSYLEFDIDCKLSVSTTTGVNADIYNRQSFGVGGSAVNMIREIQVDTRSGDPLYRIKNFNVMAHTAMKYTYPESWWETVGSTMTDSSFATCSQNVLANIGGNSSYASELGDTTQALNVLTGLRQPATAPTTIAAANALYPVNGSQTWATPRRRITIPLYCLGGIFATDKLLPSTLVSGMVIRIHLEAAKFATVWGNARLARSFPLTDPELLASAVAGIPASPAAFAGVPGGLDQTGHTVKNDFNSVPISTVTPDPTVFGSKRIVDFNPASNVSYQITNPKFVMQCAQLTDAATRSLNAVSAVNGLEIVYYEWDNTQSPPDSTKDVHIEVKKSVSRALKAFCVVRDHNMVGLQTPTGIAARTNSFANETFRCGSYYWQLGSLYYPHQAITSNSAAGTNKSLQETASNAYVEALDSFGRFNPSGNYCYVGSSEYKGTGTRTEDSRVVQSPQVNVILPGQTTLFPYYRELQPYASGAGCLAVTLERSSLFQLSGLPINNSRVLMLHANFDQLQNDDVVRTRVFDIFLKYVKIARVFMNNTETEA